MTPSPISACTIDAPAPTEQSRPICTPGPITALGPITVPAPMPARGPITAPGSMVTSSSISADGCTRRADRHRRGLEQGRGAQRVRIKLARHRRRSRGTARPSAARSQFAGARLASARGGEADRGAGRGQPVEMLVVVEKDDVGRPRQLRAPQYPSPRHRAVRRGAATRRSARRSRQRSGRRAGEKDGEFMAGAGLLRRGPFMRRRASDQTADQTGPIKPARRSRRR